MGPWTWHISSVRAEFHRPLSRSHSRQTRRLRSRPAPRSRGRRYARADIPKAERSVSPRLCSHGAEDAGYQPTTPCCAVQAVARAPRRAGPGEAVSCLDVFAQSTMCGGGRCQQKAMDAAPSATFKRIRGSNRGDRRVPAFRHAGEFGRCGSRGRCAEMPLERRTETLSIGAQRSLRTLHATELPV